MKISTKKRCLGISPNFSLCACICAMMFYYLIASSPIVVASQESSGEEDDSSMDDVKALLFSDTEETVDEESICPSLEEYEETKQSVVVSLINDTHVIIDWSNLWPDLTWRDCISQLMILIDEIEVKTISDVTTNASELELNLCETHKVKIKGLLAEDKEQFVFSNEETIIPPEKYFLAVQSKTKEYVKAENNKIVKASYLKNNDLQTNITCVIIEAILQDLVEESVCNKIKSMEIIIRESEKNEETDWTVKNQIETTFDTKNLQGFQLNEMVCGLLDICSAYNIALRVKETTKTDLTDTNLLVPLTSIGPIDLQNPDFKEAISAKDLKLEGPNGLELLYAQPTSIALQWNKSNKECFSGYIIKLENEHHNEIIGKKISLDKLM